MQIESENAIGEIVEVNAAWPKSDKDDAWPTVRFSNHCKTCCFFIPKVNCGSIRQALENDPDRPEDFYFGDNYLGICTLRAFANRSKRPAKNTPGILFPGSNNYDYDKCQSLTRMNLPK